MTALLEALRTALVSYRDELVTNEREDQQVSTYLADLRKRAAHLRLQITELEERLAQKGDSDV